MHKHFPPAKGYLCTLFPLRNTQGGGSHQDLHWPPGPALASRTCTGLQDLHRQTRLREKSWGGRVEENEILKFEMERRRVGRKVLIFRSFKPSHQNNRREILHVLLINKQFMEPKSQNLPNCLTDVTLPWKSLPKPLQGVLSARQVPKPRQAAESFLGWQEAAEPSGAGQPQDRGHRELAAAATTSELGWAHRPGGGGRPARFSPRRTKPTGNPNVEDTRTHRNTTKVLPGSHNKLTECLLAT